MIGPLILSTDELRPGDWIEEFGGYWVRSVEHSVFHGVREVTLDDLRGPVTHYLPFDSMYHVERAVARPGDGLNS